MPAAARKIDLTSSSHPLSPAKKKDDTTIESGQNVASFERKAHGARSMIETSTEINLYAAVPPCMKLESTTTTQTDPKQATMEVALQSMEQADLGQFGSMCIILATRKYKSRPKRGS